MQLSLYKSKRNLHFRYTGIWRYSTEFKNELLLEKVKKCYAGPVCYVKHQNEKSDHSSPPSPFYELRKSFTTSKSTAGSNTPVTEFEKMSYKVHYLLIPAVGNRMKLAGLYMQATQGPNKTPEPSKVDVAEHAYWVAWKQCGDMSKVHIIKSVLKKSRCTRVCFRPSNSLFNICRGFLGRSHEAVRGTSTVSY
jgi:acyl-CoA-binding protein